jgi:hypothetical protein
MKSTDNVENIVLSPVLILGWFAAAQVISKYYG